MITGKTFVVACTLILLSPLVILAQPQLSRQDSSGGRRLNPPALAGGYERGRLGTIQQPGSDLQPRLQQAAEVYKRVVDDFQERRDTALTARCIAIFPGIVEAAFIAGGERGHGVAACKDDHNRWSDVSFLHLTGASLGVQTGGKTKDLVLMFMNDKAMRGLKRGQVALGADVSATWGGNEAAVRGRTYRGDVLAYSQASGIFADALALNAASIQASDTDIREFYGRDRTNSQVLSTFGDPRTPALVKNFHKVLPS